MEPTTELGKILASQPVLALGVLIVVNFILGVMAALKDGRFTLVELSGIVKKALIYVGGYAGVVVVGEAQGGAVESLTGTVAPVLTAIPFVASALKSLNELGVPLGAPIVKMVSAEPVKETAKDRVVAWTAEANEISRDFANGMTTKAEALIAVAQLAKDYPDLPSMPPGWPTKPNPR